MSSRTPRSYILEAVVVKPITIFRDFALIAVVGVGKLTDDYLAAMAVLLLGQALATGVLANGWMPRVAGMHAHVRSVHVAASFARERQIGATITLLILAVATFLTFIPWIEPSIKDGAVILSILSPVFGLSYLLGWIGIYLFAQQLTREAQLIWALPSLVFVAGCPLLLSLDRGGRLSGAVALAYVCYFIATILGRCLYTKSVRHLSTSVDVKTSDTRLSARFRYVATAEVAAYAIFFYGLALLPHSLSTGASTILILASRIYASLSALLIGPVTQALLISGNDSSVPPRRRLILFAALAIAMVSLGLPLGSYIAIAVAEYSNFKLAEYWRLFPWMALVWAPIFLGMSAIQTLTKLLASNFVVERASLVMIGGYLCGAMVVWAPSSLTGITPACRIASVYIVYLGMCWILVHMWRNSRITRML